MRTFSSTASSRNMTDRTRTAYITGGASGIGHALTLHLLSKGWQVYIADRNTTNAEALAAEYDSTKTIVHYGVCDTASWESQLTSFQTALKALGGRIDFVAPIAGIGERKWLPYPEESREMLDGEFKKPDLSVIDVDLTGVLYTIALAVQQFSHQEVLASSDWKVRGKIGLVASVCGFYCVPSLPIYTAAKHALIGLTRSYGKLLPEEGITINAVAPNVVRTNISSDTFYQQLESKDLLTPMQPLLQAFDDMISGNGSGLVYECGPDNAHEWTLRESADYLGLKSEICCELLQNRGRQLHLSTK